ncbi:ethanolamine ammonia-lyase subunit EutC [Evansella clarkii]|uniref:ethanolamine ammonia-lyase subunit EutC n=1 Tax=Evansella clarkii TaxID=79879 RepID=UPI000B443C19|nr:ethanolamine ammonia-lyase subunit EutC [Evansella clarkii]
MDVKKIVDQVLKELERKKSESGFRYSSSDITEKVREFVYTSPKTVTVDKPRNRKTIEEAQSITPARIGIGRSGTRMKTKNYLEFRVDHAAAQDAVFKDVDNNVLKDLNLPILQSRAESMDQYLMNLDAGRKLNDDSIKWLKENAVMRKQVQIVVSDGLSSTGVEQTVPDLLPSLVQGLESKAISIGTNVFVRKSRVWIQDQIASLVDCDLVISLIGERPGLATSRSISAYIIYRPGEKSVEADRTVYSNIHEGGVPPVEAGAYLSDVIEQMLHFKASGVKFLQAKE